MPCSIRLSPSQKLGRHFMTSMPLKSPRPRVGIQQNLHRHFAIEPGIQRQIRLAHATRAQPFC